MDPDSQRCGAGRMLLKWGTAIADKMGVEVKLLDRPLHPNSTWPVRKLTLDWQTVVEATDYALHLYESEGFRVLHKNVIDLPEKWEGRDKQKFTWMVRPVKGIEMRE